MQLKENENIIKYTMSRLMKIFMKIGWLAMMRISSHIILPSVTYTNDSICVRKKWNSNFTPNKKSIRRDD